MLEIFALMFLCNKNAKLRGKSGGIAIGYTLGLWISGEVLGAVIGVAADTVRNQFQLADVSIFAGNNEYKIISSTIELGGGVTGTMAGTHKDIIYLPGATINWLVETDGMEPKLIIIELKNGIVLESRYKKLTFDIFFVKLRQRGLSN